MIWMCLCFVYVCIYAEFLRTITLMDPVESMCFFATTFSTCHYGFSYGWHLFVFDKTFFFHSLIFRLELSWFMSVLIFWTSFCYTIMKNLNCANNSNCSDSLSIYDQIFWAMPHLDLFYELPLANFFFHTNWTYYNHFHIVFFFFSLNHFFWLYLYRFNIFFPLSTSRPATHTTTSWHSPRWVWIKIKADKKEKKTNDNAQSKGTSERKRDPCWIAENH